MVVEDMPEFQPGERVRVREEGEEPRVHPDKKWLGKEGTIQYGTGNLHRGPPTFYFVEFDSSPLMDKVMAISPDWLEPRGAPRWIRSKPIKMSCLP